MFLLIKMGWLFKNKKDKFEPKKSFDANSLKFPDKIDTERVIKSENLKQAVNELKFAAEEMKFKEPKTVLEDDYEEFDEPKEIGHPLPTHEDYEEDVVFKENERNYIFVKKEVYQKILGDMKLIDDISKTVSSINKKMNSYETKEIKHFKEMKKTVNSLHDNFLRVDKVLFKN